MRAIHINTRERRIEEFEHQLAESLAPYMGDDPICIGYRWQDTGDVLFVDDTGLFKAAQVFFTLHSFPRPLAGNAVIIGPDEHWVDDDGEYHETTLDATMTLEEVRDEVVWLTHEQVHAWVEDNAAEPAVSMTSIGKDGQPTVQVLQTIADIYAPALQPKPQ